MKQLYKSALQLWYKSSFNPRANCSHFGRRKGIFSTKNNKKNTQRQEQKEEKEQEEEEEEGGGGRGGGGGRVLAWVEHGNILPKNVYPKKDEIAVTVKKYDQYGPIQETKHDIA